MVKKYLVQQMGMNGCVEGKRTEGASGGAVVFCFAVRLLDPFGSLSFFDAEEAVSIGNIDSPVGGDRGRVDR